MRETTRFWGSFAKMVITVLLNIPSLILKSTLTFFKKSNIFPLFDIIEKVRSKAIND